jgi:hypothetical protein
VDPKEVFFTLTNPGGHVEAFQILSTEPLAPDRLRATIMTVTRDDRSETKQIRRIDLINIQNEWKWYIPSPADVGVIPFISEAR